MAFRIHRPLSAASLLVALGAAAACSSGNGASPSATTGGSSTAQSVSERPAWATAARLTGEVPGDQTLPIQVHLQMRDPAGAAAALAAISDPDNAQYGHFLTDDEYNARYAPTDDDLAAVRAHLESNGLQVTQVPGNRTFIAATGTVAQINKAFSTRLGLYQVGDALKRAPIVAPTVPPAIASRIQGVLGLSESLQMHPHLVHTGGIRRDSMRPPSNGAPPKAIGGTGTCSEWYGQLPDEYDPAYGPGYPALTLAPCGYSPAQIRQAYGFDQIIRRGNDGTGIAVAVVDAWLSPTLLSDAQTFSAQNDPDYPFATKQLLIEQAPGTPSEPITDWYTEQTLDVEAAHAIAPGAKIVAVVAQSQSDQDLVSAVNLIIDKKLATIVSNSYETQDEAGLTDALIWESVGTQAGLKGIGLYFSSGDYGDESYGGYQAPTISFPGSLATITSVGGTSLALGNVGQRLWETGWETGLSFLEYNYPPPYDDGGFPTDDGGFPTDDGGFPVDATVPVDDGGEFDSGIGFDDASSFDAGQPIDASSVNRTPPQRAPQSTRVALDEGADAGYPYGGESWYPAPPGEFYFGGGGGVSILFPQPTWQAGIVPAALADKPGVAARVIPDVSMVGDPTTGFVIGQTYPGGTYAESAIGGTSLSSPLFAGVMALAQQSAKRTFGFANALLYKASKKGAFNDVLPLATPEAVSPYPGVVATFDFEAQSIHTTRGYDDVTGLGSPNGATFLANVK